MNTKRSKRHRGEKKGFKTKTKDGEAEVFVLPPDLLKKLGINLGSVENYQKCPTELTNYPGNLELSTESVGKVINTEVPQLTSEQSINKDSQKDTTINTEVPQLTSEQSIKDSQRDTTILETADLMKKSVFLSPTFVTSSNNIDTGELEISNVIETGIINENSQGNIINTDDSNSLPNQISYTYPVPEKDNYPFVLNPQINTTETSNIQNNFDHQIEMRSSITANSNSISQEILTDSNQMSLCNNMVTDILKNPVISGSIDDHSDEAYLSDCSNSNLEPSDTPDFAGNYIPGNKAFQFEVPKEFHNKIKILSEEIISSSKLKDLQIMISPKQSNFKPVSMNCLLRSKSITDNRDYCAPKSKISILEDNEQNRVMLYDETGNLLSTVSKMTLLNTIHPHNNNFDITTDVKIEKLSPISNNTNSKFETRTPENSFGDIDLAVINMEIEENEDILENFVNEITCNDDSKILEKIEQSEKDSPKKYNDLEILQRNTKLETNSLYFKIDNDEIVKNKCQDPSKLVVIDSNKTNNLCNFLKQMEQNTEFLQISDIAPYNECGTDLEIIQPNISFRISDVVDTFQNKNENNFIENSCLQTDLNIMEKHVAESLFESKNLTESNNSFPEAGNSKTLEVTECFQPNIPSNTTIVKEIMSTDSDLMKNEAPDSWSKLSVISETKDSILHLLKTSDYKISDESKDIHDNGTNIATDRTTDNVRSIDNNTMIAQSRETGSPTSKNDSKVIAEQAHDDKIKEIAMYLSQFVKYKSSSEKLKRQLDNNLKVSVKRSKSSPLTSKLRIQGVEKPGGSEISDNDNKKGKVLKTYTRSNKLSKQSSFLSEVVTSTAMTMLPELFNSASNKQLERQCDIVENSSRKPEYCLCGDFGRLAYYDSDHPYEHIHFWEHTINDCDRETVFSIYNSDKHVITDIEEVSDFLEEECQKSDTPIFNICWQSCKKVHVVDENKEIPKSLTQENLMPNEGEALSNINKANNENYILESKQVRSIPLDTTDTNVSTTGSKNLASDSLILDLNDTCKLQTEEGDTLTLAGEDNNPIIKAEVNQNPLTPKIISFDNSLKPLGEQFETDNSKKLKLSEDNTVNLDAHISAAESEEKPVIQNMTKEFLTVDSNEANVSKHVEDLKVVQKKKKVANDDNTSDGIHIPGSSKRKRKHEDNEKSGLKAKKSVKCDVCKNIVSKSEWDDHVSTEHCFIAWKCGRSLDFEEPSLLKKLQEKVKSSCLKCTFCKTDLSHPKKFLTHVQRCSAKFKASTNETTGDDIAEGLIQPGENVTIDTVVDSLDVNESITSDDNVSKCDVCKEIIPSAEWIKHITDKHDYLAWKEGDTPLNLKDEDDVRQHLIYVAREIGQLTCSKCGLSRKYPKSYMQHVQHCTGIQELQETQEDIDVNFLKTEELKPSDVVKCAVCSKSMPEFEWMHHIKEAHEYLARREGEPALDTDDEEAVRGHLNNISKQNDGLECVKCGCVRKYVKSYLVHIKSCQGTTAKVSDKLIPVIDSSPKSNKISDISRPNSMMKCGVCAKEVWSEKWIQHISKAHNYMAWKEGEESLDINNPEEVHNHLYNIVKKAGHLVCSKCGHIRKYVKPFLQHISICDVEAPAEDNDDRIETQENIKKLICALCSEEVLPKKWKRHKMDKHYNVAWTVGSVPVDFKNANVIDTLMKEYMATYKKMVCKVCKASRVSRVGFYAHVVACGKTEEEIEVHRNLCEICNKKYLCVYHNQHMAWHTQQELAKVKKQKALEEEEQKNVLTTLKEEVVKEEEVVTGRRRAAQKARNIIENFSNEEAAYRCPNCKFGSDSKKELAKHACGGKDDYFSDSGESIKLENDSGEESDDTIEIDSNVSDEEQQETEALRRRKKKSKYFTIKRCPYVPQNLKTFLTKIGAEFHRKHFTTESLYSELRVFDCEAVPPDQLDIYLPPLEESCKVRFCERTWRTYKRFEAERKKCSHAKSISVVPCHSMFTGGCIQCISWAPPGPEEGPGGDLLAVACHNGADVPRMTIDDVAPHPGLIQIWDFGDFSQTAEFALGLAHDYGTAWAMDWCPGGARDACPGAAQEAGPVLRLGLLAVAFSTGCVAVFSVPHPSTVVNREQLIQKLKPVAELRMTINFDRQVYQATSVSWSMQKPYETILVGYGDGSTAYFDLNTESPFLKTIENNIIILYPYHDERVHSTCVTGVGLYPSMSEACSASCSSSRTGAALVGRAGVRPARQHTALAAGHAHFQPLWPAAALTGDEANIGTSLNEIEWYGGGRRLGGGAAGAGCRHCGRYVLAAAPLLRVRFPHPADNVARREILGVLQMAPLVKDRKKLANDELQTQVEPITYDDVIRKYGVELRIDKESIEKNSSKPREAVPERRPERFPLGDVAALAFCPAPAHHRKLAAATHAGLLFLLQT